MAKVGLPLSVCQMVYWVQSKTNQSSLRMELFFLLPAQKRIRPGEHISNDQQMEEIAGSSFPSTRQVLLMLFNRASFAMRMEDYRFCAAANREVSCRRGHLTMGKAGANYRRHLC